MGSDEAVLGDPGIDFPEDKTIVDVISSARKDALLSFVEEVRDDRLVITAPRDKAKKFVVLEDDVLMELVWKGPEELRALPVALVGVEDAAEPRWVVRATGPAGRGQRRSAVRAPAALPVHVQKGDERAAGATVDVSEGGLRCLLESPKAGGPEAKGGAAAGLEVGDVVQVAVDLDGTELSCRGEVMRRHDRQDDRTEVSIRFIGITEHMEDLIRRYVFALLRDLRVRGIL